MNFNSKHDGKRTFSFETKASMSFIPMIRMSSCQSWKEKRLLCESVFVLVYKQSLILKNGGKRSFSYEMKASMSFNLISKTSLRCPIMKRKVIIMRIHVYPILGRTLLLWKMGEKKTFQIKPKHQCHLSQ